MELLETKRLIARALTQADAEFILRLCGEPSYIKGFRDWALETVSQAKEFMQQLNNAATYTYALVLKHSGEDVGIFTFIVLPDRAATELSVAVLDQYKGNQYGDECCRAFADYARQVLDCRTVFFKIKPHRAPEDVERVYGVKFQTIVDDPDGTQWNFYSVEI